VNRRLFLSTTTVAAMAATTGGATAALAAPHRTGTTTGAGTGTGETLRRLLQAEHDAGMVGVFAEVRDGRRFYELAAGTAEVSTSRPMRPTLRHRVGSITKTFVATTVLQLVGEGRFRLDSTIGRLLPGVLPAALGRQITVRMLLNHTSGLGNYTEVVLGSVEALESTRSRTFTPADLIAVALTLPVTNPPGDGWSYSNTNYIVLGMLVERLTGHRYGEEIQRRILRPLGMRDSYFPGADPRIRGPHSHAYVEWLDGTLRDFTTYNMSAAWAAGELISTPQDLNRFYRALLAGRLLRPSLLAEMQRTVPFVPDAPELGGYGLGLMRLPMPCGPVWGHDGGTVGHTTVSLHGGDRQVTLAENAVSLLPTPEEDPIAEAQFAFIEAALCGPRSVPLDARARGGAVPRLPRTDALAFTA
jgi:D-alanyl-D-alanine carboxypeptidase